MIFIRLLAFYSYFYIDINTALLSFQIFIESSVRYLHVGLQNEESDTESKEAKDSPTDEAQIKQEQFHLVAFHLRGSIQNVAWTKCRTKYVKPLVHR